jgi:hypothetical protein
VHLLKLSLVSGVQKTLNIGGRYLRLMAGTGYIDFVVQYKNGSDSSRIIAGIGVDLSLPETGEGFQSITFKSDIDQEIEFLVSYHPSTDSRLAGDVDVNGLLSIVSQGGLFVENSKLPLVAGVAKKVMAADVARMKASLYFDVAVSLGKDATVTVGTGYPLTAGSDWGHDNVGELWAISASAGNVYIIEDKK